MGKESSWVAQLVQCPLVPQPAGLILGQGMYLDFGFDPQLGMYGRPIGSGYRVRPQIDLLQSHKQVPV